MQINDKRKPPYQTTTGGHELIPGKVYELVDAGEAGDRRVTPGDLFLAGKTIGEEIVAVNCASGVGLRGLLDNSVRFIPVDAEVVVK